MVPVKNYEPNIPVIQSYYRMQTEKIDMAKKIIPINLVFNSFAWQVARLAGDVDGMAVVGDVVGMTVEVLVFS